MSPKNNSTQENINIRPQKRVKFKLASNRMCSFKRCIYVNYFLYFVWLSF